MKKTSLLITLVVIFVILPIFTTALQNETYAYTLNKQSFIIVNQSEKIAKKVPKILNTSVTATSITLTWSSVANANGYEIEVDGIIKSNGTSTIFVHDNLSPGSQHTYRVKIKNAGAVHWSETVTLTTTELGEVTTQLDIEAEKYEINGGTTFTVDVVIRNAEGIYAQDIIVQYDTKLFEHLGGEILDPEAMTIYHSNMLEEGKLRYIVASNGAEYGVDGDAQVLKLTFKAKTVMGEGDIKVIGGLIADGYGGEFVPEFMGKTFKILSSDVNGDGKFTLADLGIAARLLKTTETAWNNFTPDIDGNGIVEKIDLHEIVAAIL